MKRKLESIFTGLFIGALLLADQSLGYLSHAAPKAQFLELVPKSGQVEFHATGRPSLLKIDGKGKGPSGSIRIQEGKASGELSFELSTLDTGIELRNRHMKEKYLKVERNPQAKLELIPVSLPNDWSPTGGTSVELPFTAQLQLAGVAKPINGTFTAKPTEKTLQIQARFEIRISDFGIELPQFAGITVADQVQVQVSTEVPTASAPGKKL